MIRTLKNIIFFFESVNPQDEGQCNDHFLDYDDNYQVFLNENTNDKNVPGTFDTEYCNITEPEASLMLQKLLNFSTKYAITKQKTLDLIDKNQRVGLIQNLSSDKF